ncbi:MAG: tetratricopeptide repeat protein [Anaerolineales bacterium]
MLAASFLILALLAAPAADSVPLYDNLGSHHRAITTSVPRAQAYFDQGLRLTYGFNHLEAIRAFREAQRLDPNCAMCWWGEAYAWGPNINAAMDSASGVAAYGAAQRALAHLAHASPVEQALIRAIAARYAAVPPAARAPLDSVYAIAMADAVRQFPADLEVATLYADALMNLRPWNYWNREDGSPYPGTETIVAQLERVIAASPSHPGACHLYIHAVEAVAPNKAVPCAERLAALMPGAGHIVHMPAHIYVRVGRYGDAVDANVHALHADEVFIEGQKPEGIYPLAYYPHNHHFLAFAATLAGRGAQAIEHAKKTAETTPAEVARQVPFVEPFLHYPWLALVTFGKWEDVLAVPLPPADLPYSRAMVQYPRGVAFAATGRAAEAAAALDTLQQLAAGGVGGYSAVGWTVPSTNLGIAVHALAGEIAARDGRADEAIAHFTEALKIEDAQLYTEPPDWYYPIRHSLGAVLLKAGKPAEAEAVYRKDLERFRENGWALFGLAQALHAQGKHAEAAAVDERFKRAWASADVTLTASRF